MLTRIGNWQRRGRFWHDLLTGRVVPVIAGGALPATDAFTTGTTAALPTYSASWTENGSSWTVDAGNDVAYAAAETWDGFAHWNADTFDNDQYSEVVLANMSTASLYVGPGVRIPTGATQSGYEYVGDNTDGSYLVEVSSGSATQMGAKGNTFASGNTIRIEANGTTITPKINGSTTGTPGAQTDSTHASGYAGLAQGNDSTADGPSITSWEGGNLAAAATKARVPYQKHTTYFWRKKA